MYLLISKYIISWIFFSSHFPFFSFLVENVLYALQAPTLLQVVHSLTIIMWTAWRFRNGIFACSWESYEFYIYTNLKFFSMYTGSNSQKYQRNKSQNLSDAFLGSSLYYGGRDLYHDPSTAKEEWSQACISMLSLLIMSLKVILFKFRHAWKDVQF